MTNPFLETLDAELAKSPAKSSNPFLDTLTEMAPTGAILESAAKANPAKAMDEVLTARKAKLPLDVVQRNFDEVQAQVKSQQLQKMLDEDTNLRRAATTQEGFAESTSDDWPTLTKISKGLRSFVAGSAPTKPTDTKKLYENTAQRFDLMSDKDMEGMKFGELKGWTGPQADLTSIVKGLAESLPQGLEIARQGASMQMGDTLEKLGLLTRTEEYKAQEMRKLRQARLAPEYTTPDFDTTTARAAYGGGVSVLRQVPALVAAYYTRNPALVLGYIGATTEPEAYGKYKERGATFGEATSGALLETGIEVGTELMPTKFITEKFGRMGVGEFLKNLVGKELLSEQLATLGQDAVDTAIANPDKTWAQYIAERPGAAYETLIATLVQAGTMGAAHHVVTRVAEEQFREYEDALHKHTLLQEVMQTAAGSKLRELDPGTFSKFVQDAANDTEGAPKSMYMDGNTLAEVLNQAGMTEEQIAQALPSVVGQLADAVSMGSAVEIPIGELAAALPGTPLEQAIMPHLRTSEDAPSQMEAQQAQANAQEFLQASAQRVIEQAADGAMAAASAEAVRKDMYDQLMATGRMSADVASKNATLVREFFVTMSGMMKTTPEELYRKVVPYKVQGSGQKGALTQNRAAVTDTPEFKTWFGDSKVVDSAGKPLVVYRGTKSNFTEFATRRMGVGSTMFGTYEVERHGIFVTPNANLANDFATQGERNKQTGANIMPLYVDIKNPLDMTAGYTDEIFNKVEAWGDAKGLNGYRIARNLGDNWGDWVLFDKDGGQDPEFLIGMLKGLGYDGVKYHEPQVAGEGAEGEAYVAFSPTQIKSAIGNNGNFDGTDPNILNQSATLRSGEETLAKYGLPPGGKYKTRDVAAALEARQREKWGKIEPTDRSTAAMEKIANWMAEEVRFEMLHPRKSGVGWYSYKFQRALDTFAEVFPELKKDKDARATLTALIAITSDGQKVVPNFRMAIDLYRNFRETGKFTTDRGHARMDSIQGNVDLLQKMLEDMGSKAMRKYLLQEATVSDLRKRANAEGVAFKTDYQAHIKLPMAAVTFGPKLGAFYANLMGASGYLTMDRWWSRTFNRYRGTLLMAPTKDGLTRIKKLLGHPEWSDDQAISATVEPHDSYEAKGFKDGTELEKAANTVYKAAFEALEDAPFNASDRTFMLGAVAKAQQILEAEGRKISVADIQAVLWYYEKRLYGELGARQTADVSYEDAAKKVVTEQINASAAGRSNAPGAGTSAAGDDAGATLGVPEEAVAPGLEPFDIGEVDGNLYQLPGNGAGRDQGRGPAPLAGAPVIQGATGPDPQLVSVAEQYALDNGIPFVRQAEYVAVDPERAARIASAYDAMPHAPQDPAVKEAYANLIAQTLAQYEALANAGYTFTFFDGSSDPYQGNPWNAMRDLRANKTMAVYGTYAGYGTRAEVNIGLDIPAGGQLDPEAALAAIRAAGGDVDSYSVQQSDTEQTLVVRLGQKLASDALAQLSADLGQEAIAQRFADGTGELQGPNAAAWGEFNPEFFLTVDGQRAAATDNPMLASTGMQWPDQNGVMHDVVANDLFRAVHDAFGHGLEGAGFRAQGEENAWQAHSRMFTGSALGAITTETRGQNSWLNYGPHGAANQTAKLEDTVFADQKTGLMPEWTWTEGRAGDAAVDTSEQNEQRRMRQALDLLILQKGETLKQDVESNTNGRVGLKGVHFSQNTRTFLDGRYYGRGLKGFERERLAHSLDSRIKERVYFYVDEGKGVRPESGVGGAAHEADLVNLYELSADPLGLSAGGDLNKTESNVLDAGFDGYYIRNAFNQQGAAVLLGAASRAVNVTPIANPTTKAPPLPVAPQVYKRGLMSKEANAMDITAIQAVAPSAKLRSGTFQVDAAELEAARAVAKAQGIELPDMAPLQQPQAQGPRGTFNPGTLTTVLNENADLSTFLHETGHFFHEALMQMASMPDAPQEVKDLAAKALKSFGIKDIETWNAMDLEAKRPHYERFAETFELYLMTGKAPNIEIAGLFRTFRAWLTRVYTSLKAFADGKGITLDKDLTDVMDRMLASEAQIAEAEKVAGMVPELDATGEAIEQLQSRSIRDLKWAVNARAKAIKALQKEAAAKRKEVEEEVTVEVDSTNEMRAKKALDALRVDPDYTVALKTWNEERKEQLKQNQEALESELRAANPDVKGLAKGQLMMANKRQIAANAELRTLEWEKQNPKPKRPINMTDADVANIADSFEFESPEAMVQAIDNYGPRDVAIEGITDQRMLERYGDLTDADAIEAAATQAVHNQARAKSLATELAGQRAMLNKREDTGTTNAKGAKVTVNALMEAAKQFAANVIGRRAVMDLKKAANSHLQAERRAAKAWEAATAKGDTQAAVQAKQDQVLNNAAVRAAQDAQAQVKKTLEFFSRVMKGNDETVVEKGRDPDVVNAARAILAVYGFAPFKGKNAFEYMSLVQANDPQMFAVLDGAVKAAVANAKPLGTMTFDELTALKDEIDSMWVLAKSSREYEVNGNKMDIEEAGEELINRMEAKGIPVRVAGEGQAVTERERAGRSLQFAGALLRRVEQWAEGMDGKFGGPFLRLVFQPVKEAANRYRADKVAYRKALTDLVKNLAPAVKPGIIDAPEIGYKFGKGKGAAGAAELTHAILHLGNESNKRKLLLGRQWATENPDGTLNTDRWDAFMKRMHDTGVINKVHYDFAQGVWDLSEKMKPLAQETHRKVFGRFFAEVTADTLSTPFGDYRGGYVPAQVDPEIVKDNEVRKLAELENENMAYSFPSAPHGFANQRVEYNRPLLLDLRAIGQHMDKVLLFSHMEPAVRGVSKVLQSKGVAYSLNRINPAAMTGMLIPWLNRSARQIVETPAVGDGRISRVLSVIRSRAGMSLMFGNLSNTMQQVTGLTLAAVKVKPSHLAAAMAEYTKSPKKTAEAVAKASTFMAHRMDDQISALNGTMEEILLNPSAYESAQAWTQKHAYFLQSALDNVIGPVVWTGAYNQAIEEGMTEEDAARFADGTIRQTQGSTLPEDISRIESGPAYARIFTQFLGYFNMQANTNVTAVQNISDDVGMVRGAGKTLGVVFFGLLATAWVAEAVALLFKGGPEDKNKDGDYLADWLLAVFGMGTLKTVLAGVPFVGQFAMAGINTWNDKPYDDRTSMSPAISLLEGAVGAPRSVYKALVEDGSKQKAVRDVATAISIFTGLPAYALSRPLGYLAGLADDRIEPTSDADMARGLITGTASPASKQ